MTLRWVKKSKTINSEGTTIVYAAPGTPFTIESRKRHIPHANGNGTWDHTSYFVMDGANELIEKQSLKDAKEYVENMTH